MVCVSVYDPLLRSSLFVAELRETIQTAIPGIVECVKDSEWEVHVTAVSALSVLAGHGLCQRF